MTVLIVAADVDPAADHVVRSLRERGARVVRVDTGHVGTDLDYTATLIDGQLAGRIGRAKFSDIDAVYWRWPSRPSAAGGSDAETGWRQREHDAGVHAVLELIPATWINHPQFVREATKVRQYQLAPSCGLRVPDALITTMWPAASAWAASGPTVIKPLRQPPSGPMIPARRIRPDEIDETVALAPHQLQREVDKVVDVRVTVVGHDLWGYVIRSDALDWRAAEHVATQPIAIPSTVASGLRRLVRGLGLTYGAADLSVDRDGTWWLLEVNPTGAWDHQERSVVRQIADALAAALSAGPGMTPAPIPAQAAAAR